MTGLGWKPKCGDSRLTVGEELSRATTVAEVRVRPIYDDPPDSTAVEKGKGLSYSTAVEYSTIVENVRPDTDEVLAAALVDLGCTKKDAARRLAIAHARLLAEKREATEKNLMLEALRA